MPDNKLQLHELCEDALCSKCYSQPEMLDYCERCNSSLVEHVCEDCGQTTCETCFPKECYAMTDHGEVKSKLWKLRENARVLHKAFRKHDFDIVYYEGYESDEIICRYYTSYAWILSKGMINFEFNMSSSQYSNRAVFEIRIWKGVIPDLKVTQERLDFLHWDKVRVISYLEELDFINVIVHLEKIIKALT